MKAKEKSIKRILVILISLILFFVVYMYISNKYEKSTYAYDEVAYEPQISGAELVDINAILEENTNGQDYKE